MNHKSYQVLIEAQSPSTYCFNQTQAQAITNNLNKSAMYYVNLFFKSNPNETISASDLAHIFAANCQQCKLPRNERLAQTKKELNDYWNNYQNQTKEKSA